MKVAGRLSITLVAQSLAALAAFAPPVLAPVALADLSLSSDAWLGVYIALLYLAGMVSTLSSGDLIARFGPIRVTQISLLLCAAGIALVALGQTFLLPFAPLLIGLGYGPVTPSGSKVLMIGGAPRHIGLVFSVKQTGVPLGALAGGLMLPLLIALGGWRFAVCVVASLCLIAAGVLNRWRGDFDTSLDRQRRVTWRRTMTSLSALRANRAASQLAWCSLFFGCMQLCVMTFLVAYLSRVFEMSLLAAGLFMSIAQTGGILGRIGWGWLVDTAISARAVLIGIALAMGGTAVSLGLLPQSTPWWIIAAIVFVLGATAIGWNGVYLSELARVSGVEEVGRITGAALFFTYLGVVIGPPIFSAALALTGTYTVSFALISATVVLGSLLLLSRMPGKHSNPQSIDN
ncbi:MFS transporter [Salinisphaera aquimarina]|uniref:MFS transporter n=1 Tax=Salinisphaera aquimarina TaxID=2094031 RepID=A0ABV7ESC0_9GAMM